MGIIFIILLIVAFISEVFEIAKNVTDMEREENAKEEEDEKFDI